MKKRLGLLMAVFMTFSMVVPALAIELQDTNMATLAEETMNAFEKDLNTQGLDVEAELGELIDVYREEQRICADPIDHQKLQTLIDQTNTLLENYKQYKDLNSLARRPSVAVGTVISTIIAYFQGKNDVLSAELLTQMTFNETLDSNYTPYYGDKIVRAFGSSVMSPIVRSTATAGSGEFKSSNSCEDLYYAIHLFNWTKRVQGTAKLVTIKDRYDFALNDRYSGLAGTAINFLAIAQRNGEILPFYTIIPLNY